MTERWLVILNDTEGPTIREYASGDAHALRPWTRDKRKVNVFPTSEAAQAWADARRAKAGPYGQYTIRKARQKAARLAA